MRFGEGHKVQGPAHVDVDRTVTPSDGDVWTFDAATGLWKPAAATGGVSAHGDLSELDLDQHPLYLLAAEIAALIATHAGAADPHTGYQKESEKNAANGYAGLSAATALAVAQIRGLRESGGQAMTMGAVADGEYLKRSGTGLIGGTPAGAGATIVRKTADETVNNSATLQDDDELKLTVGANEAWTFALRMISNSSAAADIKHGWSIPSGGTLVWGRWINNEAPLDEGDTMGTGGLDRDAMLDLWGIIVNGATPGTLQYRWAQNAAEASDTKVLTNSHLMAHEI